MSERNDLLIIKDMIEMIEKIESFTFNMSLAEFRKDAKSIDAVYLNILQIGELANRLSEDFKDNHTDIDWFRIRGFRNKIAHEYKSLDVDLTYEIIRNQLSGLKIFLEKLV